MASLSDGLLAIWAYIFYFISMLSVAPLLKLLRMPALLAPQQTVEVQGRRFKLEQQLGEGGYAVVLLATELPSCQRPHVEEAQFAVKKVFAPTRERLDLARREIQIHEDLNHPNILRLLASDIAGPAWRAHGNSCSATAQKQQPPLINDCGHKALASGSMNGAVAIDMGCAHETVCGSGSQAAAYLVFPAVRDGNLAQEVERLANQRSGLTPAQVLDIFCQLCSALHYLHDVRGVAHRDVKPHNVLIVRPSHLEQHQHHQHQHQHQQNQQQQQQQQQQQHQQPHHQQQQLQQQRFQAQQPGALAPHQSPVSAASVPDRPQGRYQALLMDFGSACARQVAAPASRSAALALQEDAEAHCTATYRAPELFDVPTGAPLDYAACDVWAAGCTLYAAMYGASPFQRAADQPGGSVALAALNASIPWPKEGQRRYPEPLHDLVRACLAVDATQRPSAQQLTQRAGSLLLTMPADPGAAAGSQV